MRSIVLSAVVVTALVLPVSSAAAADYTVPRSSTQVATARGSDAAITLASERARGAVLAAGVDCVGWRYSLVKLEEHPSTSLYSATVTARAICVS
ncbi:hypothetical protein FHS29_004821 [Saccharothrix tamanrassetensis]|uniref:Secreted protein n=1 Tax=Saccharothrix tamanrassetensis TaxID=1051531 RepID=A0A841CMR1_9PSEU|nr:hypothetical protein [Saccharothrix tamanrassetensis]MBB5958213.1 hypothetical protein [Saccharothrix tamanrassetensis]